MEFEEALTQLRRRTFSGMKPDLERITMLADLLGSPQLSYPSVHVTGTNGKTSVTRMITTLFSAVGLQAGTYTSPHLQTPRERLSVAGRVISGRAFAEVYEELAPLAAMVDMSGKGEVTFFEYLTAMAYWWFADTPVDVGVFEVGMGGTWDATNLIRGDVSVITTIAGDHPELGATLVEKAREKSGIIKPGATVVVGEQDGDVLEVIEEAAEAAGATVLLAGRDFALEERRTAVGGQALRLRMPDRTLDEVLLPLFGAHQAENAAVALAAFGAFMGVGLQEIDDEVLRDGLGAATSPGRLEVVHREPTVLLDGAHNPAGAIRTAEAITDSFSFRNTILVIACLADKDIIGIVAPFRDVARHVVVTAAPSDRGASVEQMAAVAREVWEGTGVVVETAVDVATALEMAEGVAGEGDGVVVTGSLYTVGAARDRYLPAPLDDDEVVIEIEEDEEYDDEADIASMVIEKVEDDARRKAEREVERARRLAPPDTAPDEDA